MQSNAGNHLFPSYARLGVNRQWLIVTQLLLHEPFQSFQHNMHIVVTQLTYSVVSSHTQL